MRPVRLVRILLFTTILWIGESIAWVWGGYGSFTYPQAIWDGKKFVETGKMITVCDWRCLFGLPPKGAK